MKLSCKNSEVLNIKGADFGREEDSVCKRDHPSDETCSVVDKTNTLKMRCDGKSKCSITVLPSIFGDPCPGLNSYLNVMYVCGKKNTSVSC